MKKKQSLKCNLQMKKNQGMSSKTKRNPKIGFFKMHKLQSLQTVERLLDQEDIIYKSSKPLSKQILKEVPFVKLMHDKISQNKLYLMRLNTRIDLDGSDILTDPKMIKQIPYVNMKDLKSPKQTQRKSSRISSIVHSTPTKKVPNATRIQHTRTKRSELVSIVISSDDDEDNDDDIKNDDKDDDHDEILAPDKMSPIRKVSLKQIKSDLSGKEKSMLSPSIMKRSNSKSKIKKRVSFADSVSFLIDEDDDASLDNDSAQVSKHLQESENDASKTKKSFQKSGADTSQKKKKSPEVDVETRQKSKRLQKENDDNSIKKKEKKGSSVTTKLNNSKSQLDSTKPKEDDTNKSKANESSIKIMAVNKTKRIISKATIHKPMPASAKRKLKNKILLQKPMPASKKRIITEKYNEDNNKKAAESKKRKSTENSLTVAVSKKQRVRGQMRPMPLSKKLKLKSKLENLEKEKEIVDDYDDGNINHHSDCESPIPGNLSAEMLHKRDHVSKSKKRYSLDCSLLETKNLLSEFSSSEDEKDENNTDDRVVFELSDDCIEVDDIEGNEMEQVAIDTQATERVDTDKIKIPKKIKRRGRKRKSKLIGPIQKKKKYDIKIRFKQIKEYQCDVCSMWHTDKTSLQLHFLKHIQPLEVYIQLYRYNLPKHFNVTPYNEDRFLKSRSNLTKVLSADEDIHSIVQKYVGQQDSENIASALSNDSNEDLSEQNNRSIILENVLITQNETDKPTEDGMQEIIQQSNEILGNAIEEAKESSLKVVFNDPIMEFESIGKTDSKLDSNKDKTSERFESTETEHKEETTSTRDDSDELVEIVEKTIEIENNVDDTQVSAVSETSDIQFIEDNEEDVSQTTKEAAETDMNDRHKSVDGISSNEVNTLDPERSDNVREITDEMLSMEKRQSIDIIEAKAVDVEDVSESVADRRKSIESVSFVQENTSNDFIDEETVKKCTEPIEESHISNEIVSLTEENKSDDLQEDETVDVDALLTAENYLKNVSINVKECDESTEDVKNDSSEETNTSVNVDHEKIVEHNESAGTAEIISPAKENKSYDKADSSMVMDVCTETIDESRKSVESISLTAETKSVNLREEIDKRVEVIDVSVESISSTDEIRSDEGNILSKDTENQEVSQINDSRKSLEDSDIVNNMTVFQISSSDDEQIRVETADKEFKSVVSPNIEQETEKELSDNEDSIADQQSTDVIKPTAEDATDNAYDNVEATEKSIEDEIMNIEMKRQNELIKDTEKSNEDVGIHEDKEDDLHLCVEAEDLPDDSIDEMNLKKTTNKADEDEVKKISDSIVKSGEFEYFLKSIDSAAHNSPKSNEPISDKELINILESATSEDND